MSEQPLTYRAAGVDIDEAQRALRAVTPSILATHNERVLAGIGGFGSLFSGLFPDLTHPVLVSSIDGVGTKTKVAAMAGDYSNLGRDIVNHCVNDILCQGARPLFFLDYFGCSRLKGLVFEQVVAGAAQACLEAGCAMVGGETAEMPGVYAEDEIDVVGAIVGVLDYEKRLPRSKVTEGDQLVGLASVGLHTNGFSLARRALFEVGGLSVRDACPGSDLMIGEELLKPHRCYYSSVYPLLEAYPGLKGMAHITGGGFFDNIPRVLPSNAQAVIERLSWEPLPIFRFIQQVGNIPDVEMYRTFNMGIGMVLVVEQDQAASVVAQLQESGEHAAVIGSVRSGSNDVQVV